ncbi:MAG: hypothetical protein FD123_1530 [Bacteroidetes bacterium]|nr:MAG: hypothetical protein FD123_1530 [Bacteroidota bacterium]
MKPYHTLIIDAEKAADLPARILGVFSRRRLALERFSFSCPSEEMARVIIELKAPDPDVERSVQQIRKLIGVGEVHHIGN